MNIELQHENALKNDKEDYMFKTKVAGYDKKDVDDFIRELKNSTNISILSYKEKIEELQNNLKMTTKELEKANQKIIDITKSYDEACVKIKNVQDQSDNIERLMLENTDMKKMLEENENYIKTSAELKVRNAELEYKISQYENTEAELNAKQNELETKVYKLNSELKREDYKYKTDTSSLNVKIEMAEERRLSELSKINVMLKEIEKTIEMFNNKS